jgi:hypothetical protein
MPLNAGPLGGERRPILVEVFPIVPTSSKPIWQLSSSHSRIPHIRLGIRASRLPPCISISLAISGLGLFRSSRFDSSTSDYAPNRRTFGTRLPGYASGWFRLKNGERALAYLTRRESVVYLPTSLGYSLLLSATRPQELVGVLQSRVRH